MQILLQGAYPFLQLDDEKFLKECRIDTYQASGPGGQKRNRKYSAVRITHLPTCLIAFSKESRSYHENRKRALRRLRKIIALTIRNDLPPEKFEIPEGIRELFRENKLQINQKNPLYPIFCATIIDALFLAKGVIRDTCALLKISSGQLGKILKKDRELLEEVNQLRKYFNLKAL